MVIWLVTPITMSIHITMVSMSLFQPGWFTILDIPSGYVKIAIEIDHL